MTYKVFPTGVLYRGFSTVYDDTPPSPVIDTSSSSQFGEQWVDHVDSGYLHNWKELLRNHENAVTDLVGDSRTVISQPIRYYLSTTERSLGTLIRYYRETAVGDLFVEPGWTFHSLQPQTARNIAIGKFYADAYSKQRQFSAIISAGEFGQTLRMLIHPMKSLRQGLVNYLSALGKRGRRQTSARKKKILADTWLEYSLGLQPFIGDIESFYDALLNLQRPVFLRAIGFGRDEKFLSSSSDREILAGGNYNYYIISRNLTEILDYKVYGEVVAKNPTSLPGKSQLFGFDLASFVPSVYNLIPYSWMVDYFSNLGDIVTSASFFKSDVRWVASGMKKSVIFEANGIPDSAFVMSLLNNSNREVQFSGSALRFVKLNDIVERHPENTDTLGIPTIQFKLPGTGLKWMNIGAILLQAKRLTPFS
jgi:hypothetical protein